MRKLIIALLLLPTLVSADGIVLNNKTTGILPNDTLSFDPESMVSSSRVKVY
jgi:hypothetical protein